MKARVCFFDKKERRVKQFNEVNDFTDYLDLNFHGKYPILRRATLFLLDEMVRGRDFCMIETDLIKVAFFIDKSCKEELKFDFFIRIK